jgi:hypothetical protein
MDRITGSASAIFTTPPDSWQKPASQETRFPPWKAKTPTPANQGFDRHLLVGCHDPKCSKLASGSGGWFNGGYPVHTMDWRAADLPHHVSLDKSRRERLT